jgi:hypothetical protein
VRKLQGWRAVCMKAVCSEVQWRGSADCSESTLRQVTLLGVCDYLEFDAADGAHLKPRESEMWCCRLHC